MDRLPLFVDYQNVYMGARRAFSFQGSSDNTHGQADPMRLGRAIARRRPSYEGASPRHLQQVLVYRGLPSNRLDPKAYGAARRQVARWEASGCDPHVRALRYPNPRTKHGAEEKGIDVKLAIDLIKLATEDVYDVAVVFSADTDLLPALEMAALWGRPSRSRLGCLAGGMRMS